MEYSNSAEFGYKSPVPAWARYLILGLLAILPVLLYIGLQFLSWIEIFGSVIVLGVVLHSFISFQSGLMLLIIFLPLEPLLLKFIPGDLTLFFRLIPEAIIYSLLVFGLVKRSRAEKLESNTKLSDNPIAVALFIFVGIAVISILVNRVEPIAAGLGLRQLLRFILLYLAVILYGLKQRQIILVLAAVAVIAMAESILGLIQAAVGSRLDALFSTGREFFVGRFRVAQEIFQIRAEGSRVFATMGRYDQLGTFLALVSAAALGFMYYAKDKVRKYATLVLLLSIPTMMLTYSRASWFGFLLAVIVCAIFIQKDKKVLAGLLTLVVLLGGYIGFKEVEVRRLIDEPSVSPINRLLEAFSERRLRSEYTGKGRLYFIIETPGAVLAHSPFVGVGPGQFGGGAAALLHNTSGYDELNLPFGVYGTEGQIDNNWMSIFGETGVLGLLAYLAMFVTLLVFSRRVLKSEQSTWLAKSLALGLIGATLSFVFQGFLGTYFEMRTLAPYYWLLAALTVAASQVHDANIRMGANDTNKHTNETNIGSISI